MNNQDTKSAEQTYKDTSWFTNLLLDADDHIYETAANKRAEIATPKSNLFSSLLTLAIMLGVGIALGSVISQTRDVRPAAAAQLENLRGSTTELQQEVSASAKTISALQDEIERLRIYVLPDNSQGLQSRYESAAEYGGYSRVSGSGLEIRFLEAADAQGSDLVMDIDVISTINGLFASGATHVAVNGTAVSSLTSIRNAGSAVLIDYEPLKRPIRITAIGPTSLSEKFALTDAKIWLSDLSANYPIQVQLINRNKIRINSASIPKLEYAQRAEQ
ncbi:MAG: hypothetical protein RL038_776 [Actinomycetota bacterium]